MRYLPSELSVQSYWPCNLKKEYAASEPHRRTTASAHPPQHFINFRVRNDSWLNFLKFGFQVEGSLVCFAKYRLVDHRNNVNVLVLTVVRWLQPFLQSCTKYISDDFSRRTNSTAFPNLLRVIASLIRFFLSDAKAPFSIQEWQPCECQRFRRRIVGVSAIGPDRDFWQYNEIWPAFRRLVVRTTEKFANDFGKPSV